VDLLIKNGIVVNAEGRCAADVAVSDGKIIKVGQNILPGAMTEEVDASGLLVLPGAVDVHTHFELSFGDIFHTADDFYSGTRAAACGGVTTVIDFVTPENNESLIAAFNKRNYFAESKVCIDYGLHMGFSEVNDKLLDEMQEIVNTGVPSFKVFTTYAFKLNDDELKRVFMNAKKLNALVMVHAEDHEALEAAKAEFIKDGKTDAWHHYLSRPEAVEAKAVKKVIELAMETGVKLYIVHLACAEGLAAVEQAQAEGYPIYAETCPQYLNFTSDVFKRPDGRNFVCSPPMKGIESRDALWDSVTGCDRGTISPTYFGINTVATDHCPFRSTDKDRGKDDFTMIPNGVMGVENLYPYMLSEANRGRISFERAVELCSSNPAVIFGCSPAKGLIAQGADADILIYDPGKEFTVSQKNMHSDIDYTIWEGTKFKGYPVRTYSRGLLVYKDGEFTGKAGHGRFIRRFM